MSKLIYLKIKSKRKIGYNAKKDIILTKE